jgi:hypothetical protein
MQRSNGWLLLAIGAAALGGCGGGGTGGGVASAPTPPPTTYTKLADMTGNRTFETGGVTYSAGFLNGSSQAFGSGVTVAYNAAADSYTVTAPEGTTQTFGPADVQQINPQQPNFLTYTKDNGSTREALTIIAPFSGGNVPLSYTVIGTWNMVAVSSSTSTTRVAVGGVPTLASDMPKTGSASYSMGVGGAAGSNGTHYSLSGNSSATFTANFGNASVATALTLAGTPSQGGGAVVNFGTFNGSGTIAAGAPGYSGTLTGSTANGVFSGAFFGPQALETAYGYNLNGATFNAGGAASGIKQ